MSKKVRTLLRVSSRQQLHDNDIPVQRAEAEQYIKKHSDWVFDREYIEKAVSAYKNSVQDREALQEILADAREHKFDVLLTYMSDRIGRQEEYSFYVAALNQLGIEVWTIKDGQLKTEEHIDRLLNYIRFWQNEGESKKTSMRVRDTQRELVKSGKFVGGKAPFGYRLVPSGMVSNHGRLLKKLEIVEENAELVRRIYSLAIYQGMGYNKIAKVLNAEGISAIETDQWKGGTIRSILTNPVYMGYLAINRRVNHGSYTRLDRKDWIYSNEQIPELVIVPQDTWEKAQEIREERKRRMNTAREKSSKAYEAQFHVPFSTSGRLALTGLAYCGYCGKRLKNGSYCNHWITKAGEKKTAFTGRYLCPENCSGRVCYSQNYLESIVFQVVEGYMEQLKTIDLTAEIQKIQNQRKSGIEKELKAIQKEQRTVRLDIETLEEKIPAAIRGEYYFSADRLSAMIKEKEQLLEKLQGEEKEVCQRIQKIKAMGSDLERFVSEGPDWKHEWKNADAATKKMLLSAMINQIRVRDGEIWIKFRIRVEDFLSLETIDCPTTPYIHGLM